MNLYIICLCKYIAGEDFNGTTPLRDYFYSGQVAGDRLYFNIYIFDDDHLEKNESFYVILYGDDVEVHIQKAVVYIIDDDGKSCNYIRYSVESEIEYRPPSVIGRVYKICALLGQLLLAPKCSPKSQTLEEK